MIVVRRFRPDVRGSGNDDFTFVEVQTDPSVESRRVVVVVDTGVNATRHSSHQVEPLRRVKRRQRAGVIERDSKIEDVGVRVEEVCPRIDGFRAFQGNELAQFQIKAALREDREVQIQISLDQIGLENFMRGSIEEA